MATVNGTTATTNITIPRPQIEIMTIPIVGTEPLIVHAWSEKAKRQMLEAQQGVVKVGKKEKRDPEADYEAARYVSDEGWDGFPSVGFKASLVGACRQIDGFQMTLAKRLMFVEAEGRSSLHASGLVRIYGEPRMREDIVRLQGDKADLRYRPEYWPWRAVLSIRYNASMITPEHIANLVMLAGLSEGVGEWRPSSPKSATGNYGLWQIEE